MKRLIVIFMISSFMASCGHNAEEEKTNILGVLEAQKEAWNSHDIDGFMQHYWKSERMKFMTKDGIRQGWETTLNNYKKSYPTKEKMGELDFIVKHLEILSSESAYLLGEWILTTAEEDYGGHFSLIWKKIDGKWVIVTDHTS